MARFLGFHARDWRGQMIWYPAEPYVGPMPPFRRWRPVRPREAPRAIAAIRQARAAEAPRQMQNALPFALYRLKPYLDAIELVAMMAVATRALEGDL